MSNKQLAKNLIDQIPEGKMYYVISFLRGAAIPDEIPNEETLSAFEEINSGGGTLFTGSTSDFFCDAYRGVMCAESQIFNKI